MSQSKSLFLSAYAAAPSQESYAPGEEESFLLDAASFPGVAGLEIPFDGTSLHKFGDGWFCRTVERLPHGLSFTITTIPDVMSRLKTNPAFGLASPDPAGRRAAVRSVSRAADAVRRLNDATGRMAVRAVHLFTAPRPLPTPDRTQSSPCDWFREPVEALRASLIELAGFDWEGAQPVLEHCDAVLGAGPVPVKGFLPLEYEVQAILRADVGIGLALNWARSVIETRDVQTPLRHLRLAVQAEVLAGVALSGCSPVATRFGAAWDDTHLPPTPVENQSLLTAARIHDVVGLLALPAAGGKLPTAPYRGLKVSAPGGSSVAERVAIVGDSLAAVRHAGF